MEIFDLNLKEVFRAARLKKNQVAKFLIIPDKHYPNYCKDTHEATMEFAKAYKPHGLISIGDWFEMGAMSHWEGNANFELLRQELDGGVDLLNDLARACGKNLVFKAITLGNHELWYKRLISKQAPGLRKFLKQSGMDMHFGNVSGLTEAGYDVFEYNDGLEIGDTIFTHGIYAGAHHAKKHAEVVGKNVIYGHLESQQLHTSITARGVTQGISIGTQRDEKACSFMNGRPSNWVAGLAMVEFRYDGTSTVYTPRITGGQFSFNGKLYGGIK